MDKCEGKLEAANKMREETEEKLDKLRKEFKEKLEAVNKLKDKTEEN